MPIVRHNGLRVKNTRTRYGTFLLITTCKDLALWAGVHGKPLPAGAVNLVF